MAALLWTVGYPTGFLGLAIFFLFLGIGFSLLAATRITLVWLSKRTGRDSADMRNVLIVGTGPNPAPMAIDETLLLGTLFARMYPTDLDGTPMLTVSATPRQPVALLVKRVTDLVGSAAALVVLSPVFLFAAILVKATSRGPVFFKQERVGLNGRMFTLYKFRSMYRNAEARRAAPRSGSGCADSRSTSRRSSGTSSPAT